MILIGIDPGVNTGLAIAKDKQLLSVECMSACEAERKIEGLAIDSQVFVYYEDARMRQWFGSKGREALQGAGSIKRDCQRWEEWLIMHNIPHCRIAPQANRTKLSADQFKKLTGWEGRTNNHARDAAMLVCGR